jgi:hypothetical protein
MVHCLFNQETMTETSLITASHDDLVLALAHALFCDGRQFFRRACHIEQE